MQGDDVRAAVAYGLLAVRAERRRVFPGELFDEAAWDMLLHLFVALHENDTVREGDLFARLCDPASVCRRWLDHLVVTGQVEVHRDGQDVAMTQGAIASMRSFLDRAEAIHAMARTTFG